VYYHRCTTPAVNTPAGSDSEGAAFDEFWEYAFVVGMLIYLAINTRPYIAYVMHQAACHTHTPCASHVVAVKQITRYLKGTKTQGIIFKPDKSDQGADFAGLHSVEDGQETIFIKSHSGYEILFSGVPIVWV
jgi:hypothetical protein